MYLKSIITLIVLLVNSVCYGYVIQNIEQEGIDYKRYGEPYYPGDKLSSTDTLVYPINYEISLKVNEIKNVDIQEPYFNADFYYEIKSDYPKEYVSSYNESIDFIDNRNQSLLLEAKARGEAFKGRALAGPEYIKAGASLLG